MFSVLSDSEVSSSDSRLIELSTLYNTPMLVVRILIAITCRVEIFSEEIFQWYTYIFMYAQG